MKQSQINIEEILEQAQQGDAGAQCVLGMCYHEGINVNQSDEEAVKWIRLSANQGFAVAQDTFGFHYENGIGVEQNYEEAVKWYLKAAEQGYANAQSSLAYCYAKGNGVHQSYEEAAVWYLKAAEQGNVDAQYSLGSYYAEGKGVKQSFEEAVKFFRLAAEQGDKGAQYNLGFCYIHGLGVIKSKEEGTRWLNMSAEQGHEHAIELLNKLQHDNKLDGANEGKQDRDLSDVEELFNMVVAKLQYIGVDPSDLIAYHKNMTEMLLSIEDEETFLSLKTELLESLQNSLRLAESTCQKKSKVMHLMKETPQGSGNGCVLILAFLFSPALAVGGYVLYNLLSWIG